MTKNKDLQDLDGLWNKLSAIKASHTSKEDQELLFEFARQILDESEYWSIGCPLCGARI